jgi:hypothetical protein
MEADRIDDAREFHQYAVAGGWQTAMIGNGLATGNPHQDDDSSRSDRTAK